MRILFCEFLMRVIVFVAPDNEDGHRILKHVLNYCKEILNERI